VWYTILYLKCSTVGCSCELKYGCCCRTATTRRCTPSFSRASGDVIQRLIYHLVVLNCQLQVSVETAAAAATATTRRSTPSPFKVSSEVLQYAMYHKCEMIVFTQLSVEVQVQIAAARRPLPVSLRHRCAGRVNVTAAVHAPACLFTRRHCRRRRRSCRRHNRRRYHRCRAGDGALAATGDFAGVVRVWDLRSGKAVSGAALVGHM
jgi:hypothetical protein